MKHKKRENTGSILLIIEMYIIIIFLYDFKNRMIYLFISRIEKIHLKVLYLKSLSFKSKSYIV